VQGQAADLGELRVQGLPDQVVGEPVAPAPAATGKEHARVERGVQDLDRRGRVQVGHTTEDVEAKLGPEHRGQAQRLDRDVVEVAQAARDGGMHAGRDRDPEGVGLVDIDGEAALGREEADRFPDEQGVAAGRPADGRRGPLGQRAPDRRIDDGTDRRRVEAPEPEDPRGWLACDLGHRHRERVVPREPEVPIRGHQQHARVGELAGDEAHQEDRWRIRGLEIVQDDEQRAVAGRRSKERGHGVEQAEPRGVGIGRPGSRLGDEGRELGKHLDDVLGARAEVRPDLVGRGGMEIRPQSLDPRPVGGGARVLPAAAPQDADTIRPRAPGELVGEPALADPGRPGDEGDAPPASHRITQRVRQLAELPLPAREDRPPAMVDHLPRRPADWPRSIAAGRPDRLSRPPSIRSPGRNGRTVRCHAFRSGARSSGGPPGSRRRAEGSRGSRWTRFRPRRRPP
jgi:hypothetical protein